MSERAAEPTPEKFEACSQPLTACSKPHLFHKCLLNQYAQKLKKQLPVYQTQNEGSGHLPQFRSTVWIDGVSYTSSNTFHQRKMAEMDVSKIALFDIMQKSKNQALHLIREDKTFCKSILIEYAAKMNMEKPIYNTLQLDTSIAVFRSSVFFNGVTHQGENGKSKKEAEQLAARAVILKYLDSESGNDMSEIINCKSTYYAEINKFQETNNVPTTCLSSSVTQPPIPEASTQAIPGPFLGQSDGIPATDHSSNEIQPTNEQTLTLDYIPIVGQTSNRKRNRKSKKNAQKKMRVDAQMVIPVIPTSQVPPCSSQ